MKNNSYIPHIMLDLSRKYHQSDYFAYESPKNSFFTLGQDKILHLYSDRVEIIIDGVLESFERTSLPSKELDCYTKKYFSNNRRIFGWINFEFCIQELGIDAILADGVLLATLFIPEAEILFSTHESFDVKNIEIIAEESLRVELQDFIDKWPATSDLNRSYGVSNSIHYNLSDTYQDRVKQAILEIKQGQYDKVILSRKVIIPDPIDIEQSYFNGRLANTPARSFILHYRQFWAFGFSPELIIQIQEDSGKVITEPLAGTRACSLSPKEDEQLIKILYTDPKEVFEHAISVKTSCAEISQISQDKKASVTEFMKIKKRGVVQHMASTVEGILSKEENIFSALASLFPSVTASGLPKKEAIEAITRLDSFPRQLYSGGVGYWEPGHFFEMTLVLRSFFQNKNERYVQVGAGIVSDSNAEREFEETCEKISSIVPYLISEEW